MNLSLKTPPIASQGVHPPTMYSWGGAGEAGGRLTLVAAVPLLLRGDPLHTGCVSLCLRIMLTRPSHGFSSDLLQGLWQEPQGKVLTADGAGDTAL